MKDTKRRFEWFSFYDHTGIEKHMERMAGQGWLLEKIGSFTWHYRRVEPRKLTFSVSYFPRASIFDPGPSEEQETFRDFCAHTGWTLAASSAQLQVFYNDRSNPVPIDTDPALEVEAIHKAAKKSWLISQLMLLAVGVLNFGQFLWRLLDDTVTTLASPLLLFSLLCWPMLFVLIGTDLTTYFLWRRRALKAAEQGEFLATRSHPLMQKLALAVVSIGLVWCLSYLRGGLLTFMVVYLACTFGILFVVMQLRELLKRKNVSRGVNRAITFGACVALPLLMAAVAVLLVLKTNILRQEDPSEPPLTISDLGDYDYAAADYLRREESPLLARVVVNQSPRRAKGVPGLHYGVTVVKAGFLYGLCRDDLLRQYDDHHRYFSPIDPAPWGAREAYQSAYEDSGPVNEFLLCYPECLVAIGFDWEPTQAQMAVVGEKLGGR